MEGDGEVRDDKLRIKIVRGKRLPTLVQTNKVTARLGIFFKQTCLVNHGTLISACLRPEGVVDGVSANVCVQFFSLATGSIPCV